MAAPRQKARKARGAKAEVWPFLLKTATHYKKHMNQSNTVESLFNPMTLDVDAMEKMVQRLKEMRVKQMEEESKRWGVYNLYGFKILSFHVPIMNATV